MSKPAITAEQIADALGIPLATLNALKGMTPEGLAKLDRDAQRNARVRAAYDSAGQAASDAMTARMKARPLPHLADHGHRLASLLPGDVIAFGQGGQANRELTAKDKGNIARAESEIGAVRLAEVRELDQYVIASAPMGGMKLAHLALVEWSMAGHGWLFWFHPKLEAFQLSDVQLYILGRFLRGSGERAITVAEFDMATEIELYRRGQRNTDPRKDAEKAELERRLAELH